MNPSVFESLRCISRSIHHIEDGRYRITEPFQIENMQAIGCEVIDMQTGATAPVIYSYRDEQTIANKAEFAATLIDNAIEALRDLDAENNVQDVDFGV